MIRYALVLILVLVARGVLADEVLISQTTMSGHADTLNFGQSFTAPADANVTGIRLSLYSSMGGSEITVSLHHFDRSPLALDPAILGSGVIAEANVPASAAWIDIPISPAVPVAAGQTYAFYVLATDPGGVSGWNNYGMSFNEAYLGGEYFGTSSGSIHLSNIDDLAFEVIATDIVVPEPGTSQLLAIGGACGLAALVMHTRRRRVTRA